jgi:ribosomal-protein-alanine N-acetyltransferase
LRAAARTALKLDVSGGVAGDAYTSFFAGIYRLSIATHWRFVFMVETIAESPDQMILETSRLILRPFRHADVDLLAPLMADRYFMRFSLCPYNREQTAAFIDKLIGWNKAGLPSLFALFMRTENVFAGYCGFYHHPTEDIPDVEIGYRLHPAYWNRGLATEAARAVRDHGFRDLKLPRLISLIQPENLPSRRVAEKNGMRVEKEIIFKGSQTLVFAISREEWLARRGAE